MAHWCESCGQHVPDGEEQAGATWLGDPDDHQSDSFSQPFSHSAGQKKRGREKKLLIAVVGLLGVWGLFIGLGRVVTPDDSIDQQAAADIEEARIDREVARAVEEAEAERAAAESDELEGPEIAEVEGDYGAADAAPGFPTEDGSEAGLNSVGTREGDALAVGDRRAPSAQLERLQRQLNLRSTAAFVAYRGEEGVVVIDLVRGEATISAIDSVIRQVLPGAQVLRSGSTTFSIDSDGPVVNRVGDASSVVVSDTRDGNTYFVDAKVLSGQASIVEVIANGTYGFHRVPAGGFQLLPIDGLGLLAVTAGPAGETLIASAESFDVLRPNRVLTGSSQAVLEQICPEGQACSLVLTDLDTGEQTAVPQGFARFGDQYSLAPNGRSLLRYTPEGYGEVFVADTGSTAWVVGAGLQKPAWGPNSDFVAWIDRIGDPQLKVMFLDERDWLTIDLRDLGAPPPASPELIVFTPTVPAEAG